MYQHKQAFTLIELLVVVLIIGILAAVAVPQYRFAVLKSRYTQLITIANAVSKAEQVYILANGKGTNDFTELDFGPEVIGDIETVKNSVDGDSSIIENSQFRCSLRTYEISCCLPEFEGGGYNTRFGTDGQVCFVDTASRNADIWKKLCESLTGSKGWMWYGKIRRYDIK